MTKKFVIATCWWEWLIRLIEESRPSMFVKDFVKIISNLLRNPWEYYVSFSPILLNIANREILRFPCWCWINIWWNISFQRNNITEIQKYASNTVPTPPRWNPPWLGEGAYLTKRFSSSASTSRARRSNAAMFYKD